ncbi:MAG: hypothetical protein MUC65_04730 [Pontiellaceae bacterium]|jgi:hypothetical protein|nr:hypothetical protein [Pontiellaceae bacterium]
MNNEDIFLTWAPNVSPWSAWAKPVLFASMRGITSVPKNQPDMSPESPSDAVWQVSFANDTALILDLPGETSVRAGLAMAEKGWRPVPLFNGCHASYLSRMIVDTRPLIQSLIYGLPVLQQTKLSADAPPAFLLDQRRLSGSSLISPGDYDNRWCIVPQDMPSARYLKQAGIRRVILFADTVMDDLAHILRRYEEGGLLLSIIRPAQMQEASLSVPKPQLFRSIWYRIQVLSGLRRNAAGGFGALIPEPSTSHGYG